MAQITSALAQSQLTAQIMSERAQLRRMVPIM
jgi:hypothetical protein